MQAFHYESEKLFCEGFPLERVAERFGTPTYVYSRGAILANYRHLAEGLGRLPSLICYSVKANSNLRVLSLLHKAGVRTDNFGDATGELEHLSGV